MQSNVQQTARVGLFFLLGVALVWVAFETLSDGKVFKNKGYSLIAGYDNLKELKPGDDVRMANIDERMDNGILTTGGFRKKTEDIFAHIIE